MKTPPISANTTSRSAALSTLWAVLDAPEQDDSPQATPHPMLEGDSPLEWAKTSYGAQRVKDILIAIRYGGVV